ncbi:HEAT repeat domain-containing protein [Streptomyces sp. FH025]|uniref:HEAT repeat domain-containing protein n=1 Tax=Streptomyces sp. FH025 TaxID=2815937 RepID=UPI001A9FC846|nr:HEAT repeat domain-containing protein [Streptomyces sp. FH025]MBO1417599.1 hypothetical protein [Streptomyces sp. FH025]
MDLADVFAGLDAHPWASVPHAYGPAEDLPDLLRALAEGDDEEAEEALSDLYGAILHQGTVYAASVDAVPYLAGIAAAGRRTVEVLCLLGGLAESEDEWKVPVGAVRDAVAAQLPLILPRLADEDESVRLLAAWTVGHAGVAHALPVLRSRWATEKDVDVRAQLLTAMGRLSLSAVLDDATALIAPDTPAPLRLAALLISLRAEEPWTAAHHAAALGLLPTGDLTVDPYGPHAREPLHAIVDGLLLLDSEDGREGAFALLEAALRDPRPEVRNEALPVADHACCVSRSAPRRLLPAIAALAAEPWAATLLAKLGPLAAEAAPVLAELAAQPDDEAADRALAALLRVEPRQAAPLLARDLDRRPRALEVAGDPYGPVLPFAPGLLAAARARLTVEGLESTETATLVHLLRRWGPQAAAALPELTAVLPRFHHAAAAISAVAAGGSAAERRRAAAVLRELAGPVAVARAHHDLTGETGFLLDTVTERLAASCEVAEAARAAGDLGAAAAGLLPALRAALGDADAEPAVASLDADVAIAVALWRIEGDAEEVVPVLASVLDRVQGRQWYRWTVVEALRAAALLGTAARPLIPRLEGLLDDPEKAPAAALALLDITDPDTVDPARLADAVLRSAEAGADVRGACEFLQALGADALHTAQRWRIAELAEDDRRIVAFGSVIDSIREDERLRALLAGL